MQGKDTPSPHPPGDNAAGDSATDEDRRAGSRGSVIRRAQIIVAGTVLDCVVENLSPTGARVRLAIPSPVPQEFVLALSADDRRPARRRWARGLRIGVEFTNAVAR